MFDHLTNNCLGIGSVLNGVHMRNEGIEAIAAAANRLVTPVSRIAEQCQIQLAAFDRIWIEQQFFINQIESIHSGVQRHQEDRILLTTELPKRGWYLTGQEPCTVSDKLAALIRKSKMDEVDRLMIDHLPQFREEMLAGWCSQEGIPEYSCRRIRLFLSHHHAGSFEEATYLGVPLLDEIAKYLYKGKVFTTKRYSRRSTQQMKPEIAMKTVGGPELNQYCEVYLQEFGSLQLDVDEARLEDPDYWNRHAIVHGQMRRAMGLKDSAKCIMAFGLLVSARKDHDEED